MAGTSSPTEVSQCGLLEMEINISLCLVKKHIIFKWVKGTSIATTQFFWFK